MGKGAQEYPILATNELRVYEQGLLIIARDRVNTLSGECFEVVRAYASTPRHRIITLSFHLPHERIPHSFPQSCYPPLDHCVLMLLSACLTNGLTEMNATHLHLNSYCKAMQVTLNIFRACLVCLRKQSCSTPSFMYILRSSIVPYMWYILKPLHCDIYICQHRPEAQKHLYKKYNTCSEIYRHTNKEKNPCYLSDSIHAICV